MKIDIITYDKKKVDIGMIFTNVGFLILMVSAIFQFLNYDSGNIPLFVGLALTIFGSIFTIIYEWKNTKIGNIVFEDKKTIIQKETYSFEILNEDYSVKFSKTGYKDQTNDNPFQNVGRLSVNPGINQISFIGATEKYEYDVLIKSRKEFDGLVIFLEKNFTVKKMSFWERL
ncbi:MAG: hypothetical protein WCO54_06440 [Bacteroidota bacterium]